MPLPSGYGYALTRLRLSGDTQGVSSYPPVPGMNKAWFEWFSQVPHVGALPPDPDPLSALVCDKF